MAQYFDGSPNATAILGDTDTKSTFCRGLSECTIRLTLLLMLGQTTR
jgi:hypothetical protein